MKCMLGETPNNDVSILNYQYAEDGVYSCKPVVLNLGSIDPQGSVSQFQGFGGKRF